MAEPIGRIEVRVIVDALLLRWRLIVLCAMLAPLGAAAGWRRWNPPFVASAKVLVQENATVNPFLSDMMVDWSIKTRLPVITNVMRSRQTGEEVLMQMGRIKPSDEAVVVDREIARFQRQLEVIGLGGGVVQIKYSGATGEEARQGMDALMERFIKEMLSPQRTALDASVTFLEKQVVRVRGELEEHEQRLRVFKEEHSDELPDVYRAHLDVYLKTLQTQLDTKSELAARRQELGMTRRRLVEYDPVARQQEAELVKQRARVAQLQGAYSEAHPEVRAARAHLATLEASHKRRGSRPVGIAALEGISAESMASSGGQMDLLTGDLLTLRAAQGEVGALQQREVLLEGQASRAMEKVRSFAKNEQVLQAMERDIRIKADVYGDLLKRYEDALVTRSLTLSDEASRVWVIDRPSVPATNKPLGMWVAVLVGVAAGMALGVGLVIALEFVDPTARSRQQLGMRVLAVAPALDVQE
jgi:uncharacterized protein involved in exopolysaccharide biosynthesis